MSSEPRLGEILGSLSVATDRAAGLPPETAIRTSLLAVRIATVVGLDREERLEAYYTGLLRFLGCSAYSYEMAERFAAGDDLSLLSELTRANTSRPREVLAGAWRGTDRRAPLRRRALAVARLATTPSAPAALGTSHCELAVLLARKLGMSDGVLESLGQIYERWDGRGAPVGLAGPAIRRVARIVHVAWRLAAHGALDGESGAIEAVRARASTELEPELVDRIASQGELFDGVFRGDTFDALLDAEPPPHLRVAPDRLGTVAAVFGHFSDVKSPWTLGHSSAVADLAVEVAARLGLDEQTRESLRLASLLHDIGRVAIRNGLWDKRHPLTDRERGEVREHARETERILERSAAFREIALLASSAHERIDSGGYPRRSNASALGRAARILAACDVAVALSQDRPHRPAIARDDAMRILAAEAKAGRLCSETVDAVLAVQGHERGRRAALPHALTAREVDVVRLVARGLTNATVAKSLHVSSATVKRHLENIFEKTGHRTRAALSVWALEQNLL